MKKQIWKKAAMLLCMLCLLTGRESLAYAETGESKDSFSGDVVLLKQENNVCVMQVTAENRGEDFTGTVQLIFSNNYGSSIAYNTEITLPAQGKKQFTVNVSGRAVDTVNGKCILNFIDEEGNALQSISLSNVFKNVVTGIPVGILSDNYSGLSFMDAGGEYFDVWNVSSPMQLVELNDDNLEEYLDGLVFLVIDQFDVSSLSGENIQAIQDWVKDGGWLLVGTGEYAEQTLSGFDEDFICAEVLDISEPGEENILSVNAGQYGYYYNNYTDDGIDFTNMAIADLNYHKMSSYMHESYDNPAVYGSMGEGALAIFFWSFGEKELQKLSNYTIEYIYNELMYSSDNYYNFNSGYRDAGYVNQRAIAFMDKINTDVDFTWLKVMIVIYVILAGPILYLILRGCKKREWYWVCAPVLGILFIAGVFFLGRDIQVKETRVYSVTAQKVDGNRADTYFLAYHSGTRPWEIRLNDNYEVAGPGWGDYYGYYYSASSDCYYTVSNDSEGLSVGIRPVENFESGYLYAGGRTDSRGTISCEDFGDLFIDRGIVSGTITNKTDCDMAYMAIWTHHYIMVFSDVKAGETIDLEQAVKDGRCVYEGSVSSYDQLLYDMVYIYNYRSDLGYEQEDMAALFLGLNIADESKPLGGGNTVIAGIVKDYDRATVGKCNEISYGCLYSYVEMEGEQNASN